MKAAVSDAFGPLATGSLSVINFGSQPVGTQGQVHTLKITNRGSAPLTIDMLLISGDAAADFSLCAESCSGVMIFPGSVCQLVLRFQPRGPGRRSATISIISNATNSPWIVTLFGYGASGIFDYGDGCEPVFLYQTEAAVPVTIRADGQCCAPVIRPGRHWMEATGQPCQLKLVQEFAVTVPIVVTVLVRTECGEELREVPLMVSERVRVEVPVDTTIDVDCGAEGPGAAPRTIEAGACTFTALQHLQVKLPILLDAVVDADLEVIPCLPGR